MLMLNLEVVKMNTKIMAFVLVALLATGIGIAGARSNGSLNGISHTAQHNETQGGLLFFKGHRNAAANKTAGLQYLEAVTQCKTTFADRAAPIAANSLNVSLNVSKINADNTKFQADARANVSYGTVRSDFEAFNNDLNNLYKHAFSAFENLNQTKRQSLLTNLQTPFSQLKTCISDNTTIQDAFGFGFRGKFARNWINRQIKRGN